MDDLITVEAMLRSKGMTTPVDTGAQILRGGGRCSTCTCKHGWSGCPKLSMSDEKYAAVRYRENQT